MNRRRLVLLGVGQTATELIESARRLYDDVIGTTRDAAKLKLFKVLGIEGVLLDANGIVQLSQLCSGADVLVTFPPDGKTDFELAKHCGQARAVIYISTTGVYGKLSGVIDEKSAVEPEFPGARGRLEAEKTWSDVGGIVLRAPGLYSSQSGLHLRIADGTYRLPGDGERYTSRIHLKDLGRIILAAFEKPLAPGSLYVVGDQMPTTQREIVSWLCEQMKLPMPESAPLDAVSPTLRGNRQISATRILQDLNLKLEYPTYKEGYGECLQSSIEGAQRPG